MTIEPNDHEPVSIGQLNDIAGYHLRRASGAIAADFGRVLEGTGMRQVLMGILTVIAANPGVKQGTAGQALGIQRANMVSLINELVDRGLVSREISSSDRRAFELNISPAGEKMLTYCFSRIAAHEDRMLAGLSTDERATLIDLLVRISAQDGSQS
jgi:DNA-binding MarR family transcriptional regulator